MIFIVGAVNIWGLGGLYVYQTAFIFQKPTLLISLPNLHIGYDYTEDRNAYSYLPMELPNARFRTFFSSLYASLGLSYKFFELGFSLPVKYDQINLLDANEVYYAYGLGNPTLTLKSSYKFHNIALGLFGFYGPTVRQETLTQPVRDTRERYKFSRGLVRVFNEPDHFGFGGIFSLRKGIGSLDMGAYFGGADLDLNFTGLATLYLGNIRVFIGNFSELGGPKWFNLGLSYTLENLKLSLSYEHLIGLGNYPDVRYGSAWPDYWDVLLKPDLSIWINLSYTQPLYKHRHNIKIKVIDVEGKPLASSTIIFGDVVLRSDSMGEVILHGIKEGRRKFRVLKKDYYTFEGEVNIENDTSIVVVLSESNTDKKMAEYLFNQAKTSFKYDDYEGAMHLLNMAVIWAPDTSYENKILAFRDSVLKKLLRVCMDSVKLLIKGGHSSMALIYLSRCDTLASKMGYEDVKTEIDKIRKEIILSEVKRLGSKRIEKALNLISSNRFREALLILKAEYRRKRSPLLGKFINYVDSLRKKYVYDILSEAKTLIKFGRYLKAWKLISIAYREEPADENVLKMRKKVLRLRKVRANLLYDESLSYLNKGDTLMAISKLRESLEYFNTQKAKNLLKRLSSSKPKKVSKEMLDKLYILGLDAYQKGDYDKAYQLWMEVLRYDPNHVKARMNIERLKSMLKFQ